MLRTHVSKRVAALNRWACATVSAGKASLLSASVAACVAIIGSLIFILVLDPASEYGVGPALRLLALGLLTFGVVAGSVRSGLKIARSTVVQAWIATVIPIVSFIILWFLPTIPLERFGDKAYAMFAVSHPTVLASAILDLVTLLQCAFVIIAVTVALTVGTRSWTAARNTSLGRTHE